MYLKKYTQTLSINTYDYPYITACKKSRHNFSDIHLSGLEKMRREKWFRKIGLSGKWFLLKRDTISFADLIKSKAQPKKRYL